MLLADSTWPLSALLGFQTSWTTRAAW